MHEPFRLYSTEIDRDPFPAYKTLRDDFPCYWSEDAQTWVLTRYKDVQAAAMDWETFSSTQGNLVDEIPGRAGGTLGSIDPPRHDRLRALAQAAFAKKNLEHLAAPAARSAARAVMAVKTRDSFDFVSEVSSVVTVETLFEMLGLAPRDPSEVRAQVVLSVSSDKANKGRNDAQNAAFASLTAYIADEVEKRRKMPADDLITRLAEAEIDGDKLSDREVILTTSMFVVAGVESLSSFMTILAHNLASHPEARRRVANDLSLLPQAIEESLRFNTSAQRFKRVLTRDLTLHGQVMKAGDKVILAYGAANRDERKFPDAEVYDLDRKPRNHLGFGAGKHFCIGNALARLITQTTMTKFLTEIPDFSLATDSFDWVPSSNFRSPVTLPLRRG
ncbi:MAG: cytochrome P450 [Rhodobacteraceae bacterium]|nr:cytochrome P450 [Paracoccaceae bacterium]